MGTFGEVESPLSASSSKRGSEDGGVIASASLEVLSVNWGGGAPHGPTLYEVVYTRGGWIWRTSHRFREWLALKERLRKEYGTRSLPDDRIFPKKEDLGAIIVKLLGSCQGCREGGPVGIVEQRRRGLQAYFSEILIEKRHIWDGSEDMKNFFFPGPPTSYSAALSRRRSEQLKEEKLKAKEAAGSAASLMASSLKSTLSSLFESSPSPAPAPSPSWRQSIDVGFSPSAAAAAGSPSPDDQAAGGGGDHSAVSTPSVLNRLSAKIPSFRDFLFDAAASSPSQPQTPSQSSSRHSATGSGARYKLPSAATTNGAPSESGATDPDGGVSETGDSFNE